LQPVQYHTPDTANDCDQQVINAYVCIVVLWQKPYRNWKPRFFVRTVENQNLGFWANWIRFYRLCLLTVQSQWVGSGEAT